MYRSIKILRSEQRSQKLYSYKNEKKQQTAVQILQNKQEAWDVHNNNILHKYCNSLHHILRKFKVEAYFDAHVINLQDSFQKSFCVKRSVLSYTEIRYNITTLMRCR